jgi:hypothetical protein
MPQNYSQEEITPAELDSAVMLGQEQDAELNEMASPQGDFTKKGLNALVGAYNAIAEMFGQSPDYPMFGEDAGMLPEDFVAALMMVEAAVAEAVAAGVLSEEMGFSLADIVDDASLKVLAGKLTSIAKEQAFIAWMREGGEAPEEEMVEEEVVEAPVEDVDALFASRV